MMTPILTALSGLGEPLPTRALSLYAPWAWAIIHAGKEVENRPWRPGHPDARFRGWFWLHCSLFGGESGRKRDLLEDECASMLQMWNRDDHLKPATDLPLAWSLEARGKIVGRARVVEVVNNSRSPWFVGPLGLVLANPVALAEPIPCKGALGFWNVPADVLAQLRETTHTRRSPESERNEDG